MGEAQDKPLSLLLAATRGRGTTRATAWCLAPRARVARGTCHPLGHTRRCRAVVGAANARRDAREKAPIDRWGGCPLALSQPPSLPPASHATTLAHPPIPSSLQVTVFQQEHYLANFVQATFDALNGALKGERGEREGRERESGGQTTPSQPHPFPSPLSLSSLPLSSPSGKTLVVSGDGRFYSDTAIDTIVRMAAANGVAEVWVGAGGLLSTPAVSAILRTREGGRAAGAFILTASHNPGGPTEDFGIKYNCANGEPAPESLTNAIYERTKAIGQYYIADPAGLKVAIASPGAHDFYVQHAAAAGGGHGGFRLVVIDPVADYVSLLKTVFDFPALRRLVARPDFSMIFDGMHGVAGPYARRLFVEELGAPEACLVRCDPLPDFGGGHPDPNLTYAADLVAAMGLPPAAAAPPHGDGDAAAAAHHHPPAPVSDNPPAFGAACDGDADRNMILGPCFFVTPSDSVAILAAHAVGAIPYFRTGLKGVARSMPTSAALDRVAAALGVPCAEVPTGWKFFGNLMDAGRCSLCGEESFGTGSDHVREKDGLWAVLAWLSVLAHANHADGAGAAVQAALAKLGKAAHAATHHAPAEGAAAAAPAPTSRLIGVEDIVRAHWATYGRNYYTRYDYEGVDTEKADAVMCLLKSKMGEVTQVRSFVVDTADEFCYTDPVDGSVSAHQGIRFLFTDGSRVIYRLSGTGSSGATIRIYVEQYTPPSAGADALGRDAAEALAPLVKVALGLGDVAKLTGREAPTVIT